jgi:predicted glutamine amidotransferase
MCGIFGIIINKDAAYTPSFIKRSLLTIAGLSESRGKDSSGLAFKNELKKEIQVFKGSVPLDFLLKQKEVIEYADNLIAAYSNNKNGRCNFSVIGHSRLATNGTQLNDANNQPIIKDGIVGIHNGIIVNENELCMYYSDIKRECEIDTEVMLALVRKYINSDKDVTSAVSKTINEVFGTVATAFFIDNINVLALATNNGSLYTLTNKMDMFVFASEEYYLRQLVKTMRLNKKNKFEIHQVLPCMGVVLNIDNFQLQEFSFDSLVKTKAVYSTIAPFRIKVKSIASRKAQRELILDPARIAAHPRASKEAAYLEYNIERISALRRCSKCLLPETFPFIEYDESGTCNYCKNYRIKNNPKPIDKLFELVEPYRSKNGGYDCLVPYSGGRDSTHTLHTVKNILKLNPIAFTYDWGMVNDLARRNIARVCGKLGVENIIVSADIRWKRENIRKNILAWLKKPHLGLVPLFMAGDKYFYYYCSQVKRQTGIKLNIWGVNPLENTDFKVGFMGVRPDHKKKYIYSLSLKRKAKLISGVAYNFLTNPAYLNRSVWDTVGSFISRSVSNHTDYFHMYDYYRWDEAEIEKLVLEEYLWEKAIDTHTTWRIGDGTAPFYNYIYYTITGFSEYDTFRSNQIREGMLSREEGLKLVNDENRPRYASIKWYTEIVNIDFESTIKQINTIPKLYS